MPNPKSPEQRFADLIRRKPTPVTTLKEFRSNTIQAAIAAMPHAAHTFASEFNLIAAPNALGGHGGHRFVLAWR